MELSIIIPTFNGANKVVNLLQSIEWQTFKAFEVIVVIDGSTDETAKILRRINHTFKLTIIDQPNKGRAAARNAGATQAKGELLLFLDDDMRIEPNVVMQHIDFHAQLSQSIIIGSQKEDFALMPTDFQRYKAYLSRKWEPQIDISLPLSLEHLFLTAAHFSMPKIIFDSIIGFDERLTDAEDFDLALRAFDHNIPIYFKPEITGWHDDFVTCKSFIRRQKQYLEAHKKLNFINPLAQITNRYRVNKPAALQRMLYLIVSFPIFVWVIDHFNIFVIFPQNIRYKLYSAIVHASSN